MPGGSGAPEEGPHPAALDRVCRALHPLSQLPAATATNPDAGGGEGLLSGYDEAAAQAATRPSNEPRPHRRREAKASSTAQVLVHLAARVAALGRTAAAIAGEEKPAWPFRPVLAVAAAAAAVEAEAEAHVKSVVGEAATWSAASLQRWRELRDELLRILAQVQEVGRESE
jgi:hypothetical protein